jgi:hypothetical protein
LSFFLLYCSEFQDDYRNSKRDGDLFKLVDAFKLKSDMILRDAASGFKDAKGTESKKNITKKAVLDTKSIGIYMASF